jgi:flagellar biosynthetic protein FliQ
MTIVEAITWGQYSVMNVAIVCGPLILAAMAVGLTISLLQAVTQVQEMTLVFVPKILTVMVLAVLLGGWMMDQAVAFGTHCFQSAAVVDRE